jgi:hypothetical protein
MEKTAAEAKAVEVVTPEVKKSKFSASAIFSRLSTTHKQLLVVEVEDRNNFHNQKHIVVTECPREPCAVLYEDIFDSIIVECRSKKHNLNEKEEGEGNQPSPRETEPRTNNHTTPTTTTHTHNNPSHSKRGLGGTFSSNMIIQYFYNKHLHKGLSTNGLSEVEKLGAAVIYNNKKFCDCPSAEPGKINIDLCAHLDNCWIRKRLGTKGYTTDTSITPQNFKDE